MVTDSRGRAQAQFTLPDNLTGWRVLAMAVTPEDRMGLGSGSFRVNRETEIRPVMPNQLSVGDSFKAGFSIMNRTAETRELDVEIQVQGSRDLLPGSAREQALQQQCEDAAAQPEHDAVFPCEASAHRQQVTLLPYQRENVWLDVGTLSAGDIEFVAVAGDEQDRDALSHSVPVKRRISLTHAVSHGVIADDLSRSTTAVERINDSDARAEESVLFPEDIHSDAGGLNVILSPSILGNIDGSLRYMKEYPYGCWEQRTSKALAAAAYLQLTAYLPDSVEWEDADEYVQRMLEEAVDFQAANGGMAYWVPNERNVSPYLSAYTAFAFARLRTAGYEVPAGVERALHEYLQELLRQDEFPDYYSRGMVASVRAAALAALADSGALSEQDIARYAPQVENMSLFAKTNFLRAAVKTAGSGHDTVSDTLRQIMNHASRSSGRVQFTETRDDGYKRLLSSSARSECGALSAMLAAQDAENAADIIGDTPLTLARQVMQDRSNRGHWGNTQENVYCLNAIVDYARAYEATEPDMAVEVSFIPKPSESQASAKESIDEVMGRVSFSERSSSPVILQRPMSEGDPGLAASVHIDKSGDGTLYYANRLGYQPLEASATRVDAGIDIRREYSVERGGEFVILQSPMQIRRGELVKVDLFVSVAAARYFVVVDDPVPGGLEPLNTDLATASETDAAKAAAEPTEGSWFHQFDDWRTYNASYYRDFYHRELRHDAVRFYSDYLRPGRYHLSYVAQAIAEGEFAVQPSHSEEMYEPDIFGKSMPARLTVAE